jgi:hypothetical protein
MRCTVVAIGDQRGSEDLNNEIEFEWEENKQQEQYWQV